MNKIIQFFRDVKAAFKIFKKLIYQDVLVEELGYPEKVHDYSYTMGNEFINEMINKYYLGIQEKFNLSLRLDDTRGFILENEFVFINFIDQRYDGIEFYIFSKKYNSIITPEMWTNSGIGAEREEINYNEDSQLDIIEKNMKHYALSLMDAYPIFQSDTFMKNQKLQAPRTRWY